MPNHGYTNDVLCWFPKISSSHSSLTIDHQGDVAVHHCGIMSLLYAYHPMAAQPCAHQSGDAVAVERMLMEGTSPNVCDSGGWTPLLVACYVWTLPLHVTLHDAWLMADCHGMLTCYWHWSCLEAVLPVSWCVSCWHMQCSCTECTDLSRVLARDEVPPKMVFHCIGSM